MAPDRQLVVIDLHDFDNRRDEITAQLMHAAENVGFFYVKEPALTQMAETMFSATATFFALSDDQKANFAFRPAVNKGWEKLAQVRPSTGTADLKESVSLGFCDMEGLWPSDSVCPGFKDTATAFMLECEKLSVKLLSCFATGLDFPKDYFEKMHNIDKADCQQTLRCLFYHDVTGQVFPPGYWRAGSHTDFDTLTLLFQRPGEGGLEVCPGREAVTEFASSGEIWTPADPIEGAITINIGDMLMQWSDDKLKSTFHRVRTPGAGEYQGPRYSLAYFNQCDRSAIIQGPLKKYPPISGDEFLKAAMKRNYDALSKRKDQALQVERNAAAAP
ncbi:hypothetical protein WJX72_004518 [[Myrmecia] bisecta]|uniref:Fe2OG dioxygenase domain-containing protein n=1 Tax=[Myrmecia] bisecta TaxID=41462 RepID=A0AAW1QQE2_9CHLO